jgi:hypothetical protein
VFAGRVVRRVGREVDEVLEGCGEGEGQEGGGEKEKKSRRKQIKFYRKKINNAGRFRCTEVNPNIFKAQKSYICQSFANIFEEKNF